MKIKTYNVNVALRGELGSVVPKIGVTPAEIAMLLNLHGDVSVNQITESGSIDGNSESERDRLGKIYRDDKVVNMFGPYGALPTDISEVRIQDSLFAEKPSTPKKKAPAKKKKAAAVERNVADDEPVAGI